MSFGAAVGRSRAQRRTAPSAPATASRWLLGLNVSARTAGPPSLPRVTLQDATAGSRAQTTIVPALPSAASHLPFGLKATAVWPSSVRRSLPVWPSQRRRSETHRPVGPVALTLAKYLLLGPTATLTM